MTEGVPRNSGPVTAPAGRCTVDEDGRSCAATATYHSVCADGSGYEACDRHLQGLLSSMTVSAGWTHPWRPACGDPEATYYAIENRCRIY